MREIPTEKITDEVMRLCIEANTLLGQDVLQAFHTFRDKEESPLGQEILDQLIENARIAADEEVPICQDTGFAVIFIELGQEVRLIGEGLEAAVNEGVRRGYTEGYLRKSIVRDPLNRVNTGDNTPAILYTNIVPGDRIKITIAPKGGGSENMSRIKMLKPADGAEGVKDFVIETVQLAGSNPCPPIILGVGIGGTFDKCAQLAKKALLRELGTSHPDPFYADMEKELLEKVNALGIGPQGLGGRTTALGVLIETYPCHIASLPAAVNIQCHVARHKSVVI
ncbi:MAG: fumarate hydratase [Gemmatimonadota bacterium]|nr:MAG: fumarate hydratase [Gemmatimonadota bacterium]